MAFVRWTLIFSAFYFARVAYVSQRASLPSFDHVAQVAQRFGIEIEHCRNATARPSLRSADMIIIPACILLPALFIALGTFVFPATGKALTWKRVAINLSLLYVGPVLGVLCRAIGTQPKTWLPVTSFDLLPNIELLVGLWKLSHPPSDALLWGSHSLAVFCFLVQIWCPSTRTLMFIWAACGLAFLGDVIGHLQSDAVPFCTRQAFMQQWDSASVFHVLFHEFTAWAINLYNFMVVM